MRRKLPLFAAVVLALAIVMLLPVSFAAFSGTTTAPASLTASAYFPKVPEQVSTDSPWVYHRVEDAAASGRPATAADKAGVRPATLNGASDGPNLWYPVREATGATKTLDYSGAVNTGTANGAATITSSAGQSGSGIVIPGGNVNDYVSSAYAPIHTTSNFTVMAWAKITDVTNHRCILSMSNPSGAMSSFILKLQEPNVSNGLPNPQWQFYLPQTDSMAGSAVDVAAYNTTNVAVANTWFHIAGTFTSSGGAMRIYVNGVQGTIADTHTTKFDATGPLWVGRSLYKGNETDGYAGAIDDIRVYQRVLSQAEIQEIAGTGPASYYPLNEATAATTAADSGGENNQLSTRSGVTQLASGHVGQAAQLAATGYLAAGSWAVETTRSFTISAWAKVTSTTGTRAVVSQSGNRRPGFELGMTGGKWWFAMAQADTAAATLDQVTSTASVATGTWTHIAGVFDSTAGTITLYAGGVASTGTHTSTWAAVGPLQIGCLLSGATRGDYFADSIDEVQTWGYALTAADVATVLATSGAASLSTRNTPRTKPITAAVLKGALQGPEQGLTAGTALAFAGYTNGYTATAETTEPAQNTIAGWFRSTGMGALAGYQVLPTGGADSDTADRVLYLDSTGKLVFGLYTSATAQTTLTSSTALNDGNWHHVAASVGSGGTELYVDGVLDDSSLNTATVSTAGGYWRWGGAVLATWPNRPPADYLTGSLDEFAVFHTQLSAQQVSWQYHANH